MEKKEVSEELARVHAHLCGDGSVFIYKTKEKNRQLRAEIGYYNNNQRLLDNFRSDFSKVFNVKMSMKKKKVIIKSIKLYNILIERFGSFHSRVWRIPEIIKNSNKELKLEWLKAFFEDEAYHEKRYNRMRIKCMNLNGLKDAKEILDSLNIISRITGPNCDDSFYLVLPHFDTIEEFKGFTKEAIRR